jgi:hypothetical protein
VSKAAVRAKRSAFELQAVSVHLIYEVEMLADLVEAMRRVDTGPEAADHEWAVRNALLESFTIHVRSLADFFYPRPPPARRRHRRRLLQPEQRPEVASVPPPVHRTLLW